MDVTKCSTFIFCYASTTTEATETKKLKFTPLCKLWNDKEIREREKHKSVRQSRPAREFAWNAWHVGGERVSSSVFFLLIYPWAERRTARSPHNVTETIHRSLLLGGIRSLLLGLSFDWNLKKKRSFFMFWNFNYGLFSLLNSFLVKNQNVKVISQHKHQSL